MVVVVAHLYGFSRWATSAGHQGGIRGFCGALRAGVEALSSNMWFICGVRVFFVQSVGPRWEAGGSLGLGGGVLCRYKRWPAVFIQLLSVFSHSM